MEEESVTSVAVLETRETVFTYDDIATPKRLKKIENDLRKGNVASFCNMVHKLVQYDIPAGSVFLKFKDLLKKWCDIPDNPNMVPGWTSEQLSNHLAAYIVLYFCQETEMPVGQLDD